MAGCCFAFPALPYLADAFLGSPCLTPAIPPPMQPPRVQRRGTPTPEPSTRARLDDGRGDTGTPLSIPGRLALSKVRSRRTAAGIPESASATRRRGRLRAARLPFFVDEPVVADPARGAAFIRARLPRRRTADWASVELRTDADNVVKGIWRRRRHGGRHVFRHCRLPVRRRRDRYPRRRLPVVWPRYS